MCEAGCRSVPTEIATGFPTRRQLGQRNQGPWVEPGRRKSLGVGGRQDFDLERFLVIPHVGITTTLLVEAGSGTQPRRRDALRLPYSGNKGRRIETGAALNRDTYRDKSRNSKRWTGGKAVAMPAMAEPRSATQKSREMSIEHQEYLVQISARPI